MREEIKVTKALYHKLEEGTLFTPISKVWKEEQLPSTRCVGAFDNMCRADYYNGIEVYKDIVAVVNATQTAKSN